jgi:hypothetical protein
MKVAYQKVCMPHKLAPRSNTLLFVEFGVPATCRPWILLIRRLMSVAMTFGGALI